MNTTAPHTVTRARVAAVPLVLRSFAALAFDGIRITARAELPAGSQRTKPRTILLVSEDVALGDGLRLVAAMSALSVVRTSSLREAMEQADGLPPSAILLDMDLPLDAGWQAAEWFLGHGPNVPILMLTGRADHHAGEFAIRSGSVLEKSNGPTRLLHAVDSALEGAAPLGQRQIARQQMFLRWARPYRWNAPTASAYDYRFECEAECGVLPQAARAV